MGYAATKIAIYGIEIPGFFDESNYGQDPDNKLQVLHDLLYKEQDNGELEGPFPEFPVYVDGSFEVSNNFINRQYNFLKGQETAKTSADLLGISEEDFVRQVEHIKNNNIELREQRYQICLMGDGADSRITDEDAGVDTYAFGIFLASKGYAWDDRLKDYTNPINPIVIQRWNDYCVPLLVKAGIEVIEPEVVQIVQIW